MAASYTMVTKQNGYPPFAFYISGIVQSITQKSNMYKSVLIFMTHVINHINHIKWANFLMITASVTSSINDRLMRIFSSKWIAGNQFFQID